MSTNRSLKIKKITVSAILGSMGFILMLLEFPLPFVIPAFIKFDFSELPAIIASFAYGPLFGVLVCLIKNALHCLVSTTMCVGELSNFILGAVYVGVAGVIYKFAHNRKGALIGSIVGSFVMAIISVPINMFVTYPFFAKLYFNGNMNIIINMYQALLPSVDNLLKALLIFNLPFNFIKGIIDSAICFVSYKQLSPILKSVPKK